MRDAAVWCAPRLACIAAVRDRAKGKEEVKPADKPGSVTGIAPYDGHSSRPKVAPGLEPPTRGLERAAHCTLARAASAYLVLLRVEVAAFHPQRLRLALAPPRLVSVALFLVFAEGVPSAITYGR